MTAAAARVPEGLRDLMKGFTKEVLREKPHNIYNFSLNYFETLLEKSGDYTVKEYEQPLNYENIYRVRDCNRVPVAIVFKIIPETLTELIKDFIKAVLRENPKNICEFGVDYFRSLHKTTAKKDDIQYTTYDNFFKNKEHLSLTPYAKCTCGRSFLTEVKKEKTNIEAPQQHLARTKNGLSKVASANNPCLTHDAAVQQTPEQKLVIQENNSSPQNKPIANSHQDVNEEVYINAVYVIQRFFRNWIKAKQIKSNVSAGESYPESFKISEEAAAIIIQRSLRKLFAKKCSQNLKPYPVIPILTNIQQHEENNDNVSEAASYTSASTVRMSADSAAETMDTENSEYETIVSDEQTVSQTIMEVDEQQNEKAAELELVKLTESSINSQKSRPEDMTGVDDDIDLSLSTREIQIENEGNVDESLTSINEESNKTILHPENIETINTETKQESLKTDAEEEFIDPRLVNTSQTIHCDDSSQEDLFAIEPIENKENLSNNSSTENQEFEKFNITSEYILENNKKDHVSLDGLHAENILTENKIGQSLNDEEKHHIKKRHIEDQNITFQDGTHYDEKYLEKLESQIDDVNTINTDATEETKTFQNTNNVSNEYKLEEVKICQSESSAQLATDQEVIGVHDTSADLDNSSSNNSEDQPALENVLTEIQNSETENSPTEQAIKKAVSLDDTLEKQHPELVLNSDHINTSDSSLTQTATESLNELSHQLYQEVQETDNKFDVETIDNSDNKNGKSSARTEITNDSNKSKPLDKESMQSESQINIGTVETKSLEKFMLQVSQEEEQHEKVAGDDSVKDNLTEINNNDQNQISIESNKTSQENLLHMEENLENGKEEINTSDTDKQDSTEVHNTNEINDKSSIQKQNSAESSEVKSLEKLSHEVSKEAEDLNGSVNVKTEIGGESTKANEILHQGASEEEHNNNEINGVVLAENGAAKINNESTEIIDQISGISPNNTKNSVESIEDKLPEKLLHQTSQGEEESYRINAVTAETPAKSTNENQLDEVLHQDSSGDSSNEELNITAIADHKLTQSNNIVQTSKEDSSQTQTTIESIQTKTQDELLPKVSQEESEFIAKQDSTEVNSMDQTYVLGASQNEIFTESRVLTPEAEHNLSITYNVIQTPTHNSTDKQDCTEVNTKDQISEQGPNQKSTSIELPHTSLETEVEKVDFPIHVKDEFTENSTFDQNSETYSSPNETMMASSAQTELLNNVSEKENDIDNRDSLSTDKKDSTEVHNTNLDKHLNQNKILTGSSEERTEKEQYETDRTDVPIEHNSTETSNVQNSVKEDSDQIQHSFESNKPENEENDSIYNINLFSAVQQDSIEVIKSNQHIDNDPRQIEILADYNEAKPLEKLLYEDSEDVETTHVKSTENVPEPTKAKPLEEVLHQPSEEENKNGKLVAIASAEHDLMEINNLDQISKVESNNTQISVQLSQTTPHNDLSPMASQKDNDVDRKDSLSTDTEDPTNIENLDKDSKKGDDQPESIVESREVSPLKENDHIFAKDHNETEGLIEPTKSNSLEEQLNQELQREEEQNSSKAVQAVKNHLTDEKSLSPTQIATESNGAIPLDELLKQVPQNKEDNIVIATVKSDLTKVNNSSTSFIDNEQESPQTQSISSDYTSTENLNKILEKGEDNKRGIERENSLNQNHITFDESMNTTLDNLEIIENGDGSTKISSIEDLDDQDSTHDHNFINKNEIHTDAYESGEPDNKTKEIGFESIQNEMQRTKRSIPDIQIPEELCQSQITEVPKEVIEEVFSEKLNELNSEFSIKNISKLSTSQSDEKDEDYEIHHEKDVETNEENLSTSADNKDANPLKSKNKEKDMDSQITDTGETNHILQTSTGMFEEATTKEVDAIHDTSTVSSNSPNIGTKKPFKNINRVDISESRNNINNELRNNVGSIKSLKSITELDTVEKYEPVPDINLKSIHSPIDTELHHSESVSKLKSSNENITTTGEELEIIDMNTKTKDTSKDLDCEILGKNDKNETELKPRLENERTATYMYGVHKARQISSQTSKSLRKTTTSYNIPLLENSTESLSTESNSTKSPRHKNQQSATIESNLNTENKDNVKIDSEEISVHSSACKNTAETINTSEFSNSNKTNGTTLEKLDLNIDLDTNNNDVKTEIDLETPTKLFDELNIFDVDEKVQNTKVEASNGKLKESKNIILPDLQLDAEHLNTHQFQSAADNLQQENAFSEHSRTSSSVLKTIIELNESETPRKSESEEADLQMKKHEMINVLNAPYDPFEFGYGSDNDSEVTNSWTCSKETDENILSDEFINEIYNETESLHENKSKIVKDANTQQGGIYEMNPYDNSPVDSSNTTPSLETKSNIEDENQQEDEPIKHLGKGDTNTHTVTLSNTTENEHERNGSTKLKVTEGELFDQIEALESNIEVDLDSFSQATFVHESPFTNSATDVDTVPSKILNSTAHDEQSDIFEPTVEKIDTYKLKNTNVLLKTELSPERKLRHESSENRCSSNEDSEPKKLLTNITQVSNQLFLTETNRETRSTTLTQEEIEALIALSQSESTAIEPPLVASIELPKEISKSEFNLDVGTENNDSSFAKEQSSQYKAVTVNEPPSTKSDTDIETVLFPILNSTSHDEQNSVLEPSSAKIETYENNDTNILIKNAPSPKRNDSSENRFSVTVSSERQKILKNMPQESDTIWTQKEMEALHTPSQSTEASEPPLVNTIETPNKISNIDFDHIKADFDTKDRDTSDVKECSPKCKAASIYEPPPTNSSTDVETIPPHEKQNVVVEPSMEKIVTYENKNGNTLLKKELSHDSCEHRCSPTDLTAPKKFSDNISQVSENHSILNEDNRKITDTTLTQEEIKALVIPSQSSAANDRLLVASIDTPNKVSKSTNNIDTENIGLFFIKELSSKSKTASMDEPLLADSSTNIETVLPHDEQNSICEPPVEKIEAHEKKDTNIMIKKAPISNINDSSENRDSVTDSSEHQKILENMPQELNEDNVHLDAEDNDSSLVKEHSSKCKSASVNEPPPTTSSREVKTVTSQVEQNGILEPSIEKIESHENKHANILLKEEQSPERKLSHNSSEKLCSQVSENHSILNEDNREITNITLSQSTTTKEPPLVAPIGTQNEISNIECYPNKFDLNTEYIDTFIVKTHSLDAQKDSRTILIDEDREENASLLDKSAIIIQTAYRKYYASKNIPVSPEKLQKTQKLENKYSLTKSQSSKSLSSIQNNAAIVIQSLFRNYYARKNKSHFTKVLSANNVEELTDIEESPPSYVEIMSQENVNTDADISKTSINNIKTGSSNSTIEEQAESSSGHDKEHKIEWFVGDEPIVRSIPDSTAPLSIVNDDLDALKQVVIDDSLVDIDPEHSNKNSPTASSFETATSPSINSIENIKVDSTSSLLEPDSISLSTNFKIKHSDGTVSAEDDEVAEEGRHDSPVAVVDDGYVIGLINEEINAETHANQKTPIEKQLQEEVSANKVTSSKSLTNVIDEAVIEVSEHEITHNEENKAPQSKSLSSDEQKNEIGEQRQNDEETSSKAPNIISTDMRTESAEAVQLATEFLNSRYCEQTNVFNSITNFLDLEREYWESNIPYRCLEKPCIKKCVPLKDIDNETNNDETTTSDKSNESEPDTVDSLEASTEKFRKTDEIIEKMQQKYAAESRVNSVDERLSVEGSFEEPIIKSMKELQEAQPSTADDDETIVMKPFQREDTRESSEQSDSVVFGSEDNSKNETETDLAKASLRRLYTIPGDDANVLFKTVTIDKTIKYIEPPESVTTGTSDSNSFCLDEDTSENIRQKMMAYSLSEADSDFLGAETRDDSGSMDKSSMSRDDFNITTAMGDLDGTSTETESTIVSAATKIQAGARGFLTRRRLRRASVGTKASILEDNKASFGNAAIDESLERLIEEEAAKKIQTAYRKHYRQSKNKLRSKNDHENITCSEESKQIGSKEAELNAFSSFESPLAARRHTLQRGDAMHNDSAPDEENIVSPDTERTSKSLEVTSKEKHSISSINKETSGAAAADNGKKIKNELKWIALRQNSMPVQIESELFRVIPKHMRKRIKSAGGENKRRMRILKD